MSLKRKMGQRRALEGDRIVGLGTVETEKCLRKNNKERQRAHVTMTSCSKKMTIITDFYQLFRSTTSGLIVGLALGT